MFSDWPCASVAGRPNSRWKRSSGRRRLGFVRRQVGQAGLLQHRAVDLDLARRCREPELVARYQLRRRGQGNDARLAHLGHRDTGAFELPVPELLDGLEVERFLDTEPAQDLAEDPPCRPAVEARRDRLVAHEERRHRAGHLCQHIGPLEVGRLGQDDIRVPAGLGVAHIDRDEQSELVERVLDRVGIGQRGQRIVAVGEVGANAVGLAALESREHLMQRSGGRIPARTVGARAVDTRLEHGRHARGQALQALAADLLGGLRQHQAAGHFDVAHQRIENQRRTTDVERLLVTRRMPAWMEDHAWPVGRDFGYEGSQLIGRNTRMRLLPFGCRALDRLAQRVHAADVARDEVFVVGLLLQQFVDEGQIQRVVAVRAHLPVTVRLAGRGGGARIDVGHAHSVGHPRHEGLGLLDHQRLDDVAPVQHEMPDVVKVWNQPEVAEAEGGHRRVVAVAGAGDVVVEIIRRSQRLQEGAGQFGERTAAVRERDAAPAEGGDRLAQLVGDVIQRVVPGRAPPLTRAACARADQRRLRPLVVGVFQRQSGRAFGAQAGANRQVVRVALHPGHLAVVDRHLDRATHGAHAAHAVRRASAGGVHIAHVRCHRGTHCRLLGTTRLLDCPCRQKLNIRSVVNTQPLPPTTNGTLE